ncbi:MAG: hypothetical protein K8R54_11275 [Bacteroidales bacterium]|nr:hypothetical protein [Bacteroidales bacterium]
MMIYGAIIATLALIIGFLVFLRHYDERKDLYKRIFLNLKIFSLGIFRKILFFIILLSFPAITTYLFNIFYSSSESINQLLLNGDLPDKEFAIQYTDHYVKAILHLLLGILTSGMSFIVLYNALKYRIYSKYISQKGFEKIKMEYSLESNINEIKEITDDYKKMIDNLSLGINKNQELIKIYTDFVQQSILEHDGELSPELKTVFVDIKNKNIKNADFFKKLLDEKNKKSC